MGTRGARRGGHGSGAGSRGRKGRSSQGSTPGSGLCSWPGRVPQGLEDVSKYPELVAELLRRNWNETEVRAALAENLLRVFKEVEDVSARGGRATPAPAAPGVPTPRPPAVH